MTTKTRTALLCICTIALTQFFACKKDDAALTATKALNINNAVADSTSDSSLLKGLVAYYTFNGDLLDHSGKNNNIVFNSASVAKGKAGLPKTAYRFDGTGSYMQVNDNATLNPLKISLYALVKPTGFYQGICHSNYIMCKETTDYDQGRYLLGFGDQFYYNYAGCDQPVATNYETFYSSFGDGGSTAAGAIDSSDYISLNKWYSIVFTFDGVTSKLYVNGVLKTTNIQQSTTFTPSTTPLYIGKTPNFSYPYNFTGIIDELRIYKRALSAKEVKTLYDKY